MDIFKINVTEQQIKILNAVELYMSKHLLAKDCGSEYISQNDKAQEDGFELVCDLADIYEKYNTEKESE